MKKLILFFPLFFLTSVVFAQHTIGERYGGGIVFYVYDNGQHGLIGATEDQSLSVKWYTGINSSPVTGAFRNGIGSFGNTINMIAGEGWGNHAGMMCAKYSGGGFGDWYLPSKAELNIMYQHKTVFNNLAMWYWSSTEIGWNQAWIQNLSDGGQYPGFKTSSYHVRAIRAF